MKAYHLEIVAMHMNWVSTSVEIIDNNLDNIVVVDYLSVGCFSVDDWISCLVSSTQNGVESRDFLLSESHIIDREPRRRTLATAPTGSS